MYVRVNKSPAARKFGFINVHNLKLKLNIPEFVELVNEFDILACAETKNTKWDTVELNGCVLYKVA